jgi:hypothetical protein
MYFASESGWTAADAERAFGKAMRARRRASLRARMTRRCVTCARLAVHEAQTLGGGPGGPRVRDIPLDAIVATVEPHRAEHFDAEFRPAKPTRERWVRV